MELGSWSLITAPSLLALIPLIVMIVLVFRGRSNVSGMMVGIIPVSYTHLTLPTICSV